VPRRVPQEEDKMKKTMLAAALLATLAGCAAPAPGVAPAGAQVTTAASAAPAAPAATSAPIKFESDGSKSGLQGPFRLEAGKFTLKAEHKGAGHFGVTLKPVAPNVMPKLALNKIGAGSWEWSTLVDAPGDYYLDVSSDSAWTITGS